MNWREMNVNLLIKKILAIVVIAFILIGYVYFFRLLNGLADSGVAWLFKVNFLR